ncbi:MAG TPA: hypothetical protein VEH86_03080 [Candidatus Acidoferrum sp.]|nr:hypothetical protein [Candidatus Acidoferrum sp.]
MVRISILTALSIILIGFGVPAICVYSSVNYGFNSILAGIVAIFALIIAGILAALGVIFGFVQHDANVSSAITSEDKEKLNLLRADQRATLEELDDIVTILKEIREVLKTAQD